MNRLKKIFKLTFWIFILIISLATTTFYWYCNSLDRVNPLTVTYYGQLKTELIRQGYKDKVLVMSSKRANWHNQILTFFGASSKSRHLSGEAIDIMVLDVNDDGEIDTKDVDIVYKILDGKIIKGKGGLGTYKSEFGIWNRQMVHLDCRQKKTRWHR